MPFGTITSGANSFEPRSPGIYSLSTVVFTDPKNEFRIRGASASGKTRTTSVQRFVEKDITVAGVTTRLGNSVNLQVSIPEMSTLTATEVDALATDIATFLTAATISRLLQGES